MLKYYTRTWQEELAKRIETDPKFLSDGQRLDGTRVFRVYEGPDGKDRLAMWTFEKGQCLSWKYEVQKSPWKKLREQPFDPKWTMRGATTFQMMAALNQGEISPLRALASPEYKVEGSKLTILQMMKPLTAWNQVAAGIACTYHCRKE